MNSRILCFLLLFLAVSNLFSQQKFKGPTGVTFEVKNPQGIEPAQINRVVIEKPTTAENQTTTRRLIVHLKSAPLLRSLGTINGRSQSLENEHKLFQDDFQKIHKTISGARASVSPKILLEFKKTLNGFSVITDQAGEEKIKALPYVAFVTEDKKVEAIDNTSNGIIHADKVWQNFNITGRGVVIGIIDTGIDYMHPDLGGSIGPDSKVIGGYDFVNEDTDPMDDHGHGTHVSGIAAANGAIKGVAPDARLMGFKVLTAEGWGYDSWIVAAIERSVDPDQNPNTDDAVDIVNMSVGRSPDAAEPYSEAIENATLAGVLFVVAAGNNGGTQTISTPGIAGSAITVGASDSYDQVTWFSSRGPTEDFRIKPDVTAPGFDIYSSFLSGQYQTWSGTSMATPHVTGASALLLEKNPTWTPEMVKSALMNNSDELTAKLWDQGAGRINVEKAIARPFVVSPGSISLGLANSSETQTKTIPVKIWNHGTQAKTFSLAVTGDIQNPNVTINIQPQNFEVSAGSFQNVTLSLTIKPSLEKKSFTEGYFGKLVTTSGSDVVNTPIALVNPKMIKLFFSEPLPYAVHMMEIGGSYYYRGFIPTSTEMEVMIMDGEFDFYTYYDNYNYFVVQESVTAEQKSVPLYQHLAKNKIKAEFHDLENNPIKIDPFRNVGLTTFSMRRGSFTFLYPRDSFYISDNNYVLADFVFRDTVKGKFYDISGGLDYGQKENKIVSNGAFTQLDLVLPEDSEKGFQYYSQGFHVGVGGWGIYNYYPYPMAGFQTVYFAQRGPSDNYVYAKSMITDIDDLQPGGSYESGFFGAFEDDLIMFNEIGYKYFPSMLASYHTDHMNFLHGASMLRWNGNIEFTENQIVVSDQSSIGFFNYAHGERTLDSIHYELRSNNQVLKSGRILNRGIKDGYLFEPNLILESTAQQYQLSLLFKNQVLDKTGYAKVNLEFNTALPDKNLPKLNFFNLESFGAATNQIKQGDPAIIRIATIDCNVIPYYNGCPNYGNETKLFIKHEEDTWQEIGLQKVTNDMYERDTLAADLDLNLSIGYYTVKLVSTDLSGNSLTYELSPAFYVGAAEITTGQKVVLLEPHNHTNGTSRFPLLKWESQAGARSYTVQVSGSYFFSVLKYEAETSSTQIALPHELDRGKTYYWRARANYASGPGPWSSTFDFRTTNFKTELLNPVNNSALDQYSFVNFEWEDAEEAIYYEFQLSNSKDFNFLLYNQYTPDNFMNYYQFLDAEMKYYWRVRFYHNQGLSDWSDIFSFDISETITDVRDPERDHPSLYAYPNPSSEKTMFMFNLSQPGDVSFVIQDAAGRVLKSTNLHYPDGGEKSYTLHHADLENGIYFCRIKTIDSVKIIKLMISR